MNNTEQPGVKDFLLVLQNCTFGSDYQARISILHRAAGEVNNQCRLSNVNIRLSLTYTEFVFVMVYIFLSNSRGIWRRGVLFKNNRIGMGNALLGNKDMKDKYPDAFLSHFMAELSLAQIKPYGGHIMSSSKSTFLQIWQFYFKVETKPLCYAARLRNDLLWMCIFQGKCYLFHHQTSVVYDKISCMIDQSYRLELERTL